MSVKQSGTNRSQAERTAGGRPSRTFALATDIDDEINRQAKRLGLSRSQAISLAVLLLAEAPDAEARAVAFRESEKKK